MLYSSGQKCGSKYRWTHIDIDCDTSAKPGYAYYAEEGSCNYTMYAISSLLEPNNCSCSLMHSKYGCYSTNFPGTGGSSGIDVGWILIIMCVPYLFGCCLSHKCYLLCCYLSRCRNCLEFQVQTRALFSY